MSPLEIRTIMRQAKMLKVSNKIILFLLIANMFCAANITNASATEKPINKVMVNSISISMAKDLISNQLGKIKLDLIGVSRIEPDENNQSFKLSIYSKIFYIISTKRPSRTDQNYPLTCALLLFNESKELVSGVDTLGENLEASPWYCDGAEAMSFLDYYPDGNLKIIALYNGTPPSNEHFIDPIVIKLDVNKATLAIDKGLTDFLEEKYPAAKTIKAVRAALKGK